MDKQFDYGEAFSRNIGWVTVNEQQILRAKRIAIAGLGGVGGSHLITLARLGIGNFNISDLDTFELANFNRQAGATSSHIGRPKVDVLREIALDINPELDIRTFPEGINPSNLDDFLEDVDLYVDGLDFFALEARRAVFSACTQKEIPAVTAAPLGIGVALLNFLPGKMTFEEYFRLEGHDSNEQMLRFLLGLSPAMLQMPYLVDDSRVDLKNKKGPSTPMACELCAGMAAAHALKILLNRGRVPAAPRGVHFDAYRNKLAFTWRPGGNDNPIQRLGLRIARRRLSTKQTASSQSQHAGKESLSPLQRILDSSRWAPSGDNTQPWRFEVVDDNRFVIHAHDTRDWCVYDLDGRASQTAVGALLETISIAASAEKRTAHFNLRSDSPETKPIIEATLREAPEAETNPLYEFIKGRVTQRRPFTPKRLNFRQKQQLEAAVSKDFEIIWIEGWPAKWRMAKLLFKNAHIRLTIPEAYRVHSRIIEWDAQYSEDRIPDQAVGLDPVALKLMRWAMESWQRVKMLNRYFAGTWMPRIQLDLIPALLCGAHFVIVKKRPLENISDYFEGGGALQRLWLTSTKLGLQFQPEMTPLIFSRFIANGTNFTENAIAVRGAETLRTKLDEMIGKNHIGNAVFMGRIGIGTGPKSRSLRRALEDLSTSRE